MIRLLLCSLIVSVMAVSGMPPQADPWVNVENELGVAILGFLPMEEPYAPGVHHRVAEWLTTSDVVDKSGRVISALKYYGWTVGAMTHVVVLADVPVEGAKNQLYTEKSPELRTLELARYQLGPRAVQKVDVFSTPFARTLRMTTR